MVVCACSCCVRVEASTVFALWVRDVGSKAVVLLGRSILGLGMLQYL